MKYVLTFFFCSVYITPPCFFYLTPVLSATSLLILKYYIFSIVEKLPVTRIHLTHGSFLFTTVVSAFIFLTYSPMYRFNGKKS